VALSLIPEGMQRFDGQSDGKFDGRPPDPYSPPSWRGTLVMLLVIVVVLGLIAYAFLSIIAQPGTTGI
jgi:hypothetical protein